MPNAKARWRSQLAAKGCVVGKRFPHSCRGTVELHHVAEGSGLRHDYGLAPLCAEHHRGESGLHGMGTKNFLRLYRPPGESEYGLLVWLLEDLATSLSIAAGSTNTVRCCAKEDHLQMNNGVISKVDGGTIHG